MQVIENNSIKKENPDPFVFEYLAPIGFAETKYG